MPTQLITRRALRKELIGDEGAREDVEAALLTATSVCSAISSAVKKALWRVSSGVGEIRPLPFLNANVKHASISHNEGSGDVNGRLPFYETAPRGWVRQPLFSVKHQFQSDMELRPV
jgi:hypothetical protein